MIRRKPQFHCQGRLGLTLIEVLVSLFLVTSVLLVSITASANLLRSSHVESSGIIADQLASQILDEISTKHFRDPDSKRVFGLEANEPNTNRVAFDDVDDFHNYVSSPPSHRDGTAIDGYSGWTFTVSIQRAEVSGDAIANTANDESDLRLITVSCTSPTSEVTTRSKIVSDVPMIVDSTIAYEKWRRVTFTFSGDRQVNVAAPMQNRPEVTGN